MNYENVSNQIINWLRNKLIEAKVNGFVVGVSGGVDSATVAALCARTGFPTLLVSMPCQSNPEHTLTATNYMNQLRDKFRNIWFRDVNLTHTFESFELCMPPMSNLAKANMKSRLRMICLYGFANTNNLLVAGTGNKVEDFGVGFFTKYGDGGVDLSPIGDLLKSEVRELAKYLEVPEIIYTAVPTDGLWNDGRTDEGQLGASYEELEWAMRIDEAGMLDTQFPTERQLKVLEIYRNWHSKSMHKMNMPPVCKLEKK